MHRIILFCASICIFSTCSVLVARAQVPSSGDIVNQETLTKAYTAFEKRNYRECIRLCDNILIRNPAHPEARKLKQKARSAISSGVFKRSYPALTRRPSRLRVRLEYRYASKRVFVASSKTYEAFSGFLGKFNTATNEIRAGLSYRFPYNYVFWGFGGGGLVSVLSSADRSYVTKDASVVGYGAFARLYLGFTVLPFSKNFGLALEIDIQPSATLGNFFPPVSGVLSEKWEEGIATTLDFTFNILLQIHGWYLVTGVGVDIHGSAVVCIGLEAW